MDWDWASGPLSVNFDPEMPTIKTKVVSADGLLFHCRYGAGPVMEVLRQDQALEPTVKRLLLQVAGQTVQTYLDTLRTVPMGRNKSQSIMPLSEEAIAMKLLVDESLVAQANVVLKFNPSLLPGTKIEQPFTTLQSLCVGSASTSIKVFANLTSRDTDIRNLILRYYIHIYI